MENSLNEPTRCRNHSRATKIGQRTWNRNELCSKGVPWRSRIRKRIRPRSASLMSVTRRPKLTRAELTTERSSAIASSSRTNPWSRTGMLPSGMTAMKPRVTAPPDGLLRAVGERYDGGPFRVVEPLAGGWANDVYVVEGDAGRAVLRLKHPPSDPESIRWEHDVVARVAETVPEVVVPLRAHDGSTFFLFGGDAAWLVPHVDGAPADGDRDEQRVAAARLLGRLHTATADVDAPPRPGVDGLAQLRALGAGGLRPEWRRRVATLHAASLRTLHELERRDAVRGVVHGDFFRGNVLVRGDRVVALIDWEEAHVAPLVYDLATGVGSSRRAS